MKIKLSDYIADFFADRGLSDVFTVTGGGAMHLNDSFGHEPRLHCTYNHHEQACAIAAEAYARINNKPAVVCVTTGPGGTNAITGVVGGWLDSIPMIVISGQVRYDTTARSTGLDLRAMGDQEFDITRAVSSMTKYCEMVVDPGRIRYCLEKAMCLAANGRPGPCWLDIPLNVQAAMIETDELEGYDENEYLSTLPLKVSEDTVNEIISRIAGAKRPVFYAGNGIRLSGGFEAFQRVVRKLNIPVVTNWDSIDLIPDDDALYCGRGGIMGDRAGNFAVQNSDLVFSVGSRLSIRQVGYNWKTWAREAYVIMEDIDENELKKPTLHVDMPLHVDAKALLDSLDRAIGDSYVFGGESWLEQCRTWKKKYPVVLPKHYENGDFANVYCLIKELSRRLPEDFVTVVGNGSACVVGSHGYEIKKGQRFIINSAIASMGYDLPAAIGVCTAVGRKPIVCLTGEGSLQMNLQELQTILTNRLPIKLFVINNGGYHSIRQTQTNLFDSRFVGIGEESRDLEFPALDKLAYAYGYKYFSIHSNAEMGTLDDALGCEVPMICEIFVSRDQFFEPKSATKRLEDGTLVSPPLEDLAPFLPREDLAENMYIKMI